MVKTKNNFWAYVLLFLIVLYTLKGALYPTGIISMCIAGVELGICLIIGILDFKYKKRNYVINILFIIVGLISISFVFSSKIIYSSLFGKMFTLTFFREFIGAIFPVFGMYYFARRGQVSLTVLKYFFYLIFIASIIAFFYETLSLMTDLNKEEITSNASYRFVYIMPFIVFIKGKFRVALLWIVALSIAVLSAKRGAILGIILECTIYYCWDFKASRHKVVYLLSIYLICAIGGYYLYQYYKNDSYAQMRVDETLEGKSSGRDVLLNKLFAHFTNADLTEMLKGAGFAQTLKIAGNYAHNDWIEILIDCGIVGFVCYGLFYICMLRSIKYSKDKFWKSQWLILIAFLPTSFYSMVFFSEGSSIGFLWIGYILGCKDRNKSYQGTICFNKKRPIFNLRSIVH